MNKTILFVVYTLFLILFAIFSYAFVDPNFIYLKNLLTNFTLVHRQTTTVLFIFSICIFFGFYFLFIWLFKIKFLSNKNIIQLIVITVVMLFFSYPAMLSYDIFNYIATAKVLFFYKENPYLIMPIEFPGDPLLLFTRAANKIALYGIFWILINGLPFLSGFGNFLLILFNFKLLTLFFYFGTIFIIRNFSKNFLSILLFALNPLVIIETLVSSHNDIVMVFFMLLGFYLLKEKKTAFAGIFFVLSIFIKYSTIFLVPVFVYLLWRIIKKRNIQWNTIFLISSLIQLAVILFIAPIREEIYPWYAIWFFSFACLVPKNKALLYTSISFSFSLLLRYIPYMLLGTYNGPTPTIKTIVTFIPPLSMCIYIIFQKLKSEIRIPKPDEFKMQS